MKLSSSACAVALGLSVVAAGAVASSRQADVDASHGAMRPFIERYLTDRDLIDRYWGDTEGAGGFGARGRRGGADPFLPGHLARMRQFYTEWTRTLAGLDFDGLDQEGKIDDILLRNRLQYELGRLDTIERDLQQVQPLAPFAKTIVAFDAARREGRSVVGEDVARELSRMIEAVAAGRRSLEGGAATAGRPASLDRATGVNAVAYVQHLRAALKAWFDFYNGYDPQFTWWVGQTYKDADQALEQYTSWLRDRFRAGGARALGVDVVDPIGRDALIVELRREMIPYTPEELVAIANREFAWCEQQMLEASHALGYGDDWHRALEHVKTMHVAPGQQPAMVRGLVLEGIAYVEQHDLVTVPPLAREMWRMAMMSAERQLVSPFFLGGETILVSYPTDTMTFEQKMMSMRGNNIPFSRAVAFHEMIPGHELQAFMTARYRTYRAAFGTPFWTEGNALWWEMLFYDMGFPRTPEERIGMLFWRMHRCARIVFSLGYHLGTMTPEQAVDFLVERVGHERNNAEGEVRRSFNGSYPPLYQCAYMIGALQFRALYQELVASKKMTARAFHDAILRENRIPIELIRADLERQPLTRDFETTWRFYGPVSPPAP